MEPNHSFRIFSRSAVSRILRSGPLFHQFLDRHLTPDGPVRRFPNGAIEIDERRVKGELIETFKSYSFSSLNPVIQGAGVYRPIGPFRSGKIYGIQYDSNYQKKLNSEESFRVGLGIFEPPSSGEFDLAQLEVTIGFRTKPSKATRMAFTDAVATWARATSDRGAFDDGPISLISPDVSFNGIRSWFRIDARRSGQDTLNWLALAMLDFGEDVHTTTRVEFGKSSDVLDNNLGPIRGDIAVVEFTRDHHVEAVAGPAEPTSTTHVPSTAKPARGFRSRGFAVLALPVHEWDTFVATIYFGRPLHSDEREQLVDLLDAWILLSSWGGLGGIGSHSAEEVVLDEATDSATIRADMGDVDPRFALRVLIRSLEQFQMAGPSIEALVFGRIEPGPI